jgi:hypothetical protein
MSNIIPPVKSPEDEEDLDSLILAHSPRFQKLLAEADERVRRTGGISLAEVKQRLAAHPSNDQQEMAE